MIERKGPPSAQFGSGVSGQPGYGESIIQCDEFSTSHHHPSETVNQRKRAALAYRPSRRFLALRSRGKAAIGDANRERRDGFDRRRDGPLVASGGPLRTSPDAVRGPGRVRTSRREDVRSIPGPGIRWRSPVGGSRSQPRSLLSRTEWPGVNSPFDGGPSGSAVRSGSATGRTDRSETRETRLGLEEILRFRAEGRGCDTVLFGGRFRRVLASRRIRRSSSGGDSGESIGTGSADTARGRGDGVADGTAARPSTVGSAGGATSSAGVTGGGTSVAECASGATSSAGAWGGSGIRTSARTNLTGADANPGDRGRVRRPSSAADLAALRDRARLRRGLALWGRLDRGSRRGFGPFIGRDARVRVGDRMGFSHPIRAIRSRSPAGRATSASGDPVVGFVAGDLTRLAPGAVKIKIMSDR